MRIRVDPGHVGGRVQALAALAVIARTEQAELLPVAQGAGGQPGQLGDLADAPQDGIGLDVRLDIIDSIAGVVGRLPGSLSISLLCLLGRGSRPAIDVVRLLDVDVPASGPGGGRGQQAGHDGEVERGVQARLGTVPR